MPCICSKCDGNPDSHFYPYQNLIEARKQGVKEIQCQISFTLISIEKLLGGIEDEARKKSGEKLQKIKVFLGSSAELAKERQDLKQLFYDETKKYINQNIFLDLVIWEEKKKSFHESRFQERLNEHLLECDIAIFLFFKKVGKFTKEEYDTAFKHFKAGNKPRHLIVFFKSEKVEIDEIDPDELKKIQALKKEIEEAEQIYASFNSNDNLMRQLKNQLDLIIAEMG